MKIYFFLVDVAHLKVSANTLNFDAREYLEIFKKDKIGGYHLSDNNGLVDSNKEIFKILLVLASFEI